MFTISCLAFNERIDEEYELYLKLSGRNCILFFSFTIRLQWVTGHSFLTGNDAADKLARLGALLLLSAIPCSVSHAVYRD